MTSFVSVSMSPAPVIVPSAPTSTPDTAPVAKVIPAPAKQPEIPRPARPETRPEPAPSPAPALSPAPPPAIRPEPPADEGAEAPAHLKGDPLATLRWSDDMLRTFPGNAKAYALRAAALYDLGRYGEIPGTLQAAVASGVTIRSLFRFPRFVHMVQEEASARRLPEAVRAQLGQLPGARAEDAPRPFLDRRKGRFRK